MEQQVITVDREWFMRMSRALVKMERFIEEKEEARQEWVSEEAALRMLGCCKRTLFKLKNEGQIKYKAVGKKHQYHKKSIEKYNALMSTL